MTPTMLGAINAIALLQTTMSFVTIARGDLSGVDEPRQVVIRTVEEWQALWTEHSGGTSVPDVDFSRSLVAGVFQGSRPTAGFQVEITGGTRRTGRVVVPEHGERRPPAGQPVAQILTAPFHMISLSRDVGEVRLQRID